jgi:hypothetical protein
VEVYFNGKKKKKLILFLAYVLVIYT